ncbi:acyl carrier protein [uncultured Aquimarina sp.]|uniref:acyl carrier protein n=1 Tax=uncultured Aquimarina sp. TaxID=575652 RepID=UPI00260A5D05|nr:hypothetical protein [uncultured Aquimarina sp.]
MNTDIILDTIKNGLIDSIPNITKDQIVMDAHLKNDLGIDSLSSMFFLTFLEDNIQGFEVNADTIEAKHFNTLKSIFEYVLNEMKIPVSAI